MRKCTPVAVRTTQLEHFEAKYDGSCSACGQLLQLFCSVSVLISYKLRGQGIVVIIVVILLLPFPLDPACALHALFFTIMCCVYLCLIFFFAVCSSVGLFVVFYAQLTSHGEIRISFYYCVELLLVVIIINAFCIEEIYTGSHFFK